MNSFDFNIDNYSINDLIKFLNLSDDYTEEDVHQKANEFSSKIQKVGNPQLQQNLNEFVNKVKTILTTDQKYPQITNAGDTYVIRRDKYPVTNYVQQVYQTEVAKGTITSLKKKTTITTFCINTLFRDAGSNSATDCIYSLPYTIKEVLSMELISVEIPQSIFLFSSTNFSNTMYFKEYVGSTVNELLVVFPPGNYPNLDSSKIDGVATMMTATINQQLNSGTRFTVTINPVTNQITISNSTNNFDMYILYVGTNPNMSKTMGWILGYRSPFYRGQMTYTTESLYNVTPAEYLYLELNDYNVSQASTKVIGLFAESYLDKNILGKILYTYSQNYTSYYVIAYDKSHVVGGLRQYFGPTNLQRFGIRLLDRYGEVVDLNGISFSFTLELKVLYDL